MNTMPAYLAPADWFGMVSLILPVLGGIAYIIFRAGQMFTMIESMKSSVDRIPAIEYRLEGMDHRLNNVERGVAELTSRTSQVEQKVGDMNNRLNRLEDRFTTMRHLVAFHLKGIYDRINHIERDVDELRTQRAASNSSPISLNELGKQILMDSRVGRITDLYYRDIVRDVMAMRPANAYQAQEAIIDVLARFKKRKELRHDLEMGAYLSGNSIDTVLFVAAIHVRDRVFSDLRLTVGER